MPKKVKILRSFRFWATIVALPFLLLGCASTFFDFESDFVSDEFIQRETISVDVGKGIELSYLRSGDPSGQRVIFVNGTPGDAGGNWVDMLRGVPEGFEFIAIDRPGFGLTKPKKQLVALDDQAAAIAPLFVERDGRKTILAGHSLGGPIVAAAAANYPDQVGGIAVLAGALDPELEDVLFIQYIGNIPPISWLLPKVARHSNRELIALEDELRLLEPKLATITQPVVIVHGTEDELVPYKNVPFMQRTMTNAQSLDVIKIEGMNHFLQWRQRDVIMDAVMSIAEQLKANHEDITAASPPNVSP
ncbi:alpha/beta fold hydrolase [Kordiimonas aquimaris]|uniref:alpha/beta fold hydrolase n=1 Tax=Kordiimonas aquimaris TaxID=707591 RepID=UPI0021CE4D11|nr:alpha/beta hydrolase [Kordiimonas aquimaris]